jgi:glycosyltransferase involved in cell wall biosynthesis
MAVSVIIPCYNASRWIRETLDSVCAGQSMEMEIIVVDDGSKDDTAAIVEQEFAQARLIRTQNRGASHARNTGTQAASGEYIQYLDADDLLVPGKIAAQMKLLVQTGADVAYGDWQRLVWKETGFEAGEIVQRRMRRHAELELFGYFWCPPAVYLFRRSIVERIGSWNPRLPIIQDARFALDCALHGARFAYQEGIVAFYREHGTDSLSRKDPVAFVRDVYRNAGEVEQWWLEHGGITEERRVALVECLGFVARASYEQDRDTFDQACEVLDRVAPGYVPVNRRKLAFAAKLVGYRRAEAAAAVYRRVKRVLH